MAADSRNTCDRRRRGRSRHARALALAGHEVMLIERHDRLGTETSARNSEVVHAGLYYPTGSMRARLCVAGKELLYRFCDENGVAAKRCGKLLVATTEAELPKLHAIAEQAARNGVNDLVALSGRGRSGAGARC